MIQVRRGEWAVDERRESAFSPAARWIWAWDEGPTDAWWMFRRAVVLPSDCRGGRLSVTAAFHYLLYVNGRLVTRGPARSYDFRKAYDTVDVQPYLRPGAENVLAILAPTPKHMAHGLLDRRPRGVLAELSRRDASGVRFIVATDRQWKVRRHPAFPPGMAGRSPGIELLLWQEERFDARREPLGWNAPGFNDTDWEAARELGPVGTAPWTVLEPSGIGLLSDDPVLPRSFTAIELARLPPGYRFRLEAPVRFIDRIKLFATEVTCAAPATVRLHASAVVYLNGRVVEPPHVMELPQGVHWLCLCQRGYCTSELDVLLETRDELSFSAQSLLDGGDLPWALRAFPSAAVNYPWHETPTTASDPPKMFHLLAAAGAGALPPEARADFMPVTAEAGSVALDVTTQFCHRVRGGHTDPMIERAQPRLPSDAALVSPLRNPHNLLHEHPDATTILPTPGYDTHFTADFGIEVIGYLEFVVDAPEGTTIDMQAFEYIGPDGIVWMHHNGFRYVCREGLQTFTSHSRRGFRYVSVTVRGFERPVQWYALRCRRTTCPVRQAGAFECSDGQLNQAYRMSVETSALCMLDTYVDCPGHEQSFWVGDAPITGQSNLLNFGAYDLDQRSIRLVGLSLSPDWVKEYWPDDERYTSGRYLPIAAFPNYPPEGGLPMWPLLWLIQCWNHYLHGGDSDHLRENYGYVAEMLRRCRLLTNERGLLDIPGAWNLLDWGMNDLSPYGEVTANNAHLVLGLRLAAKMARAVGLEDAARAHAAEGAERQAAINRLCWDDGRQAYVDTVRDEWAYQRYLESSAGEGRLPLSWEKYRGCLRVSEQTNTAALFCGCVPPERLDAVRRIVRRVERGRFVTGSPAGRTPGVPSEQEAPDGIVAIGTPYFLFFTLGVLFDAGEGRLAMDVIRREWGGIAARGFRTCPETFGWPRSAAHGWSASPAVYLPSRVLGIRPLEPGYRAFVVDPCPCDLEWACGSVMTPHGPIHAKWQRTANGELEIDCTAPPECRQVQGHN